MRIEVKKDRLGAVLGAIRHLTMSEVLIGVPFESAPRSAAEDQERKASGAPLNNAEIGYINEFGLPEKNIPARPHLLPGIADVGKRLGSILADGAKQALSGQPEAAPKALTKAGLIAATAVKSRIADELSPALAPSTLKQRKRRGRTGEVPIFDTGEYLRSITSVICPKDERKRKKDR